jgi:hypothetical protein
VAGCVSTLAQAPTPEIDKAECSWLASEGKVFLSNLPAGDQLCSTVSVDGIANTAERMTSDASPEAMREREALRNASIDLKNWLNDLEGDAEQEVRAMGAGAVVASLGRQGVVLVDSLGVLVGSVTGVVARNTIGAVDALLAGFIATPDDRVAQVTRALVWASSAVQSESTLFDIDRAIENNVSVSATWDAHKVLGIELPEISSV